MSTDFKPLAVVGVSALFPSSVGAQGFWRNILAGRDLITDVPPHRWLIEDHYDPDPRAPDKTYCKRGGFLGDVGFDPVEFGIPPSALPATDTCQLLALMVAKEVLDEAMRGQFRDIDRERASVILGVTSGQELFLEVASRLQVPVWTKALRECGIPEEKVLEIRERISGSYVPWQENTFPGLLGNVVAGRIANRFNLGGTNCVTDAACASSLSALSMAASELQLGRSDLVITGGADTFNDVSMFVCFSKTPALSPTGDCRPFSDRADGTVLGEGLAMVALRRLEDAERDGQPVYAVVRGIGSSSDGRSKSIYAPAPAGQARAMRRAYEAAGYGPETVELVEAHGTGTAAGDAAEIHSLTTVFGAPGETRAQYCALGSVKSQVGHTKAAAGAAGLFKAVMALHHKVLPPTIKVERPHPELDSERSPFYINTRLRPWVRGTDHPRRASVSSFGFGGTNFHVALEEYTGAERPARHWTAPAELVLIGAEDATAVSARCREMARDAGSRSLAEIGLASQLAFDAAAPVRLALVCESGEDLERKLQAAAEGSAAPGVYRGAGQERGRLAFLFPGQGSQYVGMTADLAIAFGDSRAVWDQASPFAKVVFPPPTFSAAEREAQARRLTATEWAQPAIGAASAALLALLGQLGVTPDCVGGHSFGEITALFAAGACSLDAMLRMARRRGELMAAAPAEPGGMLSVRQDAASLQQFIAEWGLDVVIANHNSPRQSVLSGKAEAITEAAAKCAAARVDTARLPVSTAFHSPLVAEAVAPFGDFLETCEIGPYTVPFYSNFDGGLHPADADGLRERVARQIARPVHFARMVERMYEDGVRTFLEVGPGSVLTSLVDAILQGRPHSAIAMDKASAHGVVSLWHALGQLAALGYPLDWQGLRAGQRVEVAPQHAAGRFLIPINGGNYGRPYPPPGGAAALPPPVTAPPEPVPAPAPVPAAVGSPDVVQAYQIFQESINEAHRNWQANLARGHESFLKAMESAYIGTVSGSGIAGAIPLPPRVPGAVVAAASQAPPEPKPVREAVSAAPPRGQNGTGSRPAPAPEPVPELAGKTASPTTADVRTLLWNLIAETTGYPAEMLHAEMSLEADLGIDSIKRVEIFSALQQRLPAAAEFDQGLIGELHTLADIVAYLGSSAPASAAAPAAGGRSTAGLGEAVLRIVAEKTGYPVEMLHAEMSLEADLGIDSIKRVEIFSELQQLLPMDREPDQAEMGELNTIADVMRYWDSAAAPAPPAAPSPSPDAHAAAVLAVVAEKTGYPVEMLHAEMSLEADLGIDSIKRVEIFSALQEALPGLPAFDTAALGELGTIADVIAFLNGFPVAAEPATAPPTRLAVGTVEFPASGHVMLDADDGPVCIVGGGACGERLAEVLRARGFEVFPAAPDACPRPPKGVISLEALGTTGACANQRVFRTAQSVAAAWATGGGVFVAVRDAADAWSGGLAGLVKTAAIEWPRARVKAIEIEASQMAPEAVALALAGELLNGGPELEVTLTAEGRRLTPRVAAAPCGGGAVAIGPESVLVVSGGARGITARCALALARHTRCKMLLLGRSGGDTAEVRETLQALQQAGSPARYACLDARDGAAVASALAEARRQWGPITGIIHGAGVLADRAIANLSPAQFESVFSTKVEGLRALLDATSEDPLDVLCMFSSVAARYGNAGQAAYAMANETINRAARAEGARRTRPLKVKVIDWGPWAGGMVTPELARRFEAHGVALLGLEDGAAAFAAELLEGAPGEVEVVIGGVPPAAPRELRVRIDQRSHPFLADHQIQDVPVLPVVEALEMFLRCARAQENAVPRLVCADLKVLRGVRLDGFFGAGNRLTVRPRGEGVFELIGPGGVLHYQATVLPDAQAGGAAAPFGDLEPLRQAPWNAPDIYQKLLFHGPAFQVIRDVGGISDAGICGTVTGIWERQWHDGFRHSDSGMLDGGLQLARLWGYHSLGKPTLPARIGEIRAGKTDAGTGPITCMVAGRTAGGSKIVCDVEFRSADGGLVATMSGVEMYAVPGE